jgi:hypothetical protein
MKVSISQIAAVATAFRPSEGKIISDLLFSVLGERAYMDPESDIQALIEKSSEINAAFEALCDRVIFPPKESEAFVEAFGDLSQDEKMAVIHRIGRAQSGLWDAVRALKTDQELSA